MLNNITLGRYYQRESTVHSLSPIFKILSLIIMIISMFFIDNYIDILMLGSYLILGIVYSNINIKTYLKNIIGIKIFLIFVLIIDIIFFVGINKLICDLFRIIFIILYSSILTYTTVITELTYGIERILKPLNKIIPISDISMVISLAIRYIPSLTDEATRIIKAQKLRGVSFDSKNIKEKLISISGILIPMFVMSIKKSEKMADIMDLRLYNYGKSKTNYRSNKWKQVDTLLLILNIVILIIVMFY